MKYTNNIKFFENSKFELLIDSEVIKDFKICDIDIIKNHYEYIKKYKGVENYNTASKVLEEMYGAFCFEGYLYGSETIEKYEQLECDELIEDIIINDRSGLEYPGEEGTVEYKENIVYMYWQTIGENEYDIFEENIIVNIK